MSGPWYKDDDDLAILLASPKPPPFVKGSDTSKAAADSIKPFVAADKAKVFQYIEKQGDAGSTDDQIEVALDLRHQTASARRRDLVLDGAVKDSRERRKTRSGRSAAVWVAVPKALREDQRKLVKARGEAWKELMVVIEEFTPEELRWLAGIAGQKGVLAVDPKEVQDDTDYLDE